MKLTKIYIEGEDSFIREILEFVRPHIGQKVNIVDLNPELVMINSVLGDGK